MITSAVLFGIFIDCVVGSGAPAPADLGPRLQYGVHNIMAAFSSAIRSQEQRTILRQIWLRIHWGNIKKARCHIDTDMLGC